LRFWHFWRCFLLIGSGGFLLFYREVMLKRISEAISPRPKEKRLTSAVQKGEVLARGHDAVLETLMPKSEKEVSVLQQRLVHAG